MDGEVRTPRHVHPSRTAHKLRCPRTTAVKCARWMLGQLARGLLDVEGDLEGRAHGVEKKSREWSPHRLPNHEDEYCPCLFGYARLIGQWDAVSGVCALHTTSPNRHVHVQSRPSHSQHISIDWPARTRRATVTVTGERSKSVHLLHALHELLWVVGIGGEHLRPKGARVDARAADHHAWPVALAARLRRLG